MDCKKLFACIDGLNEEYLTVLEEVCRLESPTGDKARVDAVGDYFVRMAQARGWQVEVREMETAGNPVCITLNPRVQAAPITLSGHIDTVHPVGAFGPEVVRRDAENLYGPGTADCKGGVVAAFMAMDGLERCGFAARPVQLIIQTDEETNSTNSGQKTVEFLCEKARGSVAFLNAECTRGEAAVIARKGILRYRLTVHGGAKGSAQAEATHKLHQLEQMKQWDGLICNSRMVRSDTPERVCVLLVDIFFVDEPQCRQAQAQMQAVAEENAVESCTCILEQVSLRPHMPLTQRNEQLMQRLNDICRANGLRTLEVVTSPAGSDGAYITHMGVPCVDGIGVSGGMIHSVKEYIRLDSLAESAKRMAGVAWCI